MSSLNALQLETEVERMTRAIMTRNWQIGYDLICYLRSQMSLEEVAGVMIISLERVIWFDAESVVWSIKNLIPEDLMAEIRQITSVTFYKRLINRGFVPGIDFSLDAHGKLLVNDKAKRFVLSPKC
jgi:hypothetical protein